MTLQCLGTINTHSAAIKAVNCGIRRAERPLGVPCIFSEQP